MDTSGVFALRAFTREPARTRLALVLGVAGLGVYVLKSVQQLLNLDISHDYVFYLRAAQGLGQGADIYAAFQQVCPRAGAGCQGFTGYYIYPPLLAELMRPLTAMSVGDGAMVWLIAGHAALALALVVIYRTIRPLTALPVIGFVAGPALMFLPLYENLYFMQVNTLLLAVLALAAYWFVRQPSGVGAGLALGFGAVLRVTPAAMGLALVRSRRSLPGLAAMAAIAGLLVAALAVATPATTEYLTSVLPRLAGSTPWVENQSLPGALGRAAELAATSPLAIGPPVVAILGVAPILLTLVVVAATLVRSRGIATRRGRAAVFAAFLAALPIYASVTEQHHLVAEILVYALLAPSLAAGSRPWWLALAAYPFLWISHDDPLVWALSLPGSVGDYALAALMMVPLNLVGMILLWLSCQEVLRRADRSSPP
jgi:hypothetical protein